MIQPPDLLFTRQILQSQHESDCRLFDHVCAKSMVHSATKNKDITHEIIKSNRPSLFFTQFIPSRCPRGLWELIPGHRQGTLPPSQDTHLRVSLESPIKLNMDVFGLYEENCADMCPTQELALSVNMLQIKQTKV